MGYHFPISDSCYNSQGCIKTKNGRGANAVTLGKNFKRKAWFFTQVCLLYTKTGKTSSLCKPCQPFISMDAIALVTGQINQFFGFYLFVNLTIFKLTFKENIKN